MTESSKEGVNPDIKDTIDRKLDELNVSKTEAGKDQKQKPDTEAQPRPARILMKKTTRSRTSRQVAGEHASQFVPAQSVTVND